LSAVGVNFYNVVIGAYHVHSLSKLKLDMNRRGLVW